MTRVELFPKNAMALMNQKIFNNAIAVSSRPHKAGKLTCSLRMVSPRLCPVPSQESADCYGKSEIFKIDK